MGKSLVIVESPTKARTISKFLGKDFVVESSIGHIRDLPRTAKEIPEDIKGTEWARLGIDIENDFQPLYIVPPDKKTQVNKLKKLLKDADELYLATDEDREGESISWHLCEVLKPKVPRKRLVFHEITREAIQEALRNPRDIDVRLVQAQETRRILDRLYGYEVSPVLWKKIRPKLSAGRVQSVAVRMIVERERERMAFVRSVYWDLAAQFVAEKEARFGATLVELDGKRVASGRDFDESTGKLKPASEGKVTLLDERTAKDLTERLRSSTWRVASVERKPYTTRPAPPFTTSTLQQEANRKLRYSAQETMRLAQRLYENGWITYMRTDSMNLSEEAIRRAREVASELYGADHLPADPRRYRTKVKNAQEAHEAIRPSSEFRRPDELRNDLDARELRLYELIWKRTVASQMEDARGHRITVRVTDGHAVFQASGRTIDFAGFLRAYVEGADDPDAELADQETLLPDLSQGDEVRGEKIEAREHATLPPARYTEASLVKALEANGVGRPSTYASIIDTILRRDYVRKQQNALVPTFTAFAVTQLLERYFTRLIDVQFTANMEDDLDEISLGERQSVPYLRAFYFGNGDGGAGNPGLRDLIAIEIDPRESCTIPLGEDPDGRPIVVRVGRYGPFLERGDERASIPDSLAPDEVTIEKAVELLAIGSGPRELGKDPETGRNVSLRVGRFGGYVQLEPASEGEKPKNKSLLPGMQPEEVTLETALKLLSLPRSLGSAPTASGEDAEILVDHGRFGPYVKHGDETRSLKEGDDVFEITRERALELLAEEPKRGGWRSRAKPKVLRELGTAPGGESPVQVLSGRYGPYVTDGEVNVSLREGDDPESISLERAVALLEEKRAKGGGRKKATRKAAKKTTKKAGQKTSTTKAAKTAKSGTTKKKAASKGSGKAAKKAAETNEGAGDANPSDNGRPAAKRKTASTRREG